MFGSERPECQAALPAFGLGGDKHQVQDRTAAN
jgi:hypothetical protein